MIVTVIDSDNRFWFQINQGYMPLPRVGEVLIFEGKSGIIQGINHSYRTGKKDRSDGFKKPWSATIKVKMLPSQEEN